MQLRGWGVGADLWALTFFRRFAATNRCVSQALFPNLNVRFATLAAFSRSKQKRTFASHSIQARFPGSRLGNPSFLELGNWSKPEFL